MPAEDGSNKEDFLEAVKAARQERALEKQRETSVIIVQACVRRWLAQRSIHLEGLHTFDGLLGKPGEEITLKPAIEVYRAAKTLLFICKKTHDGPRLEHLCRHLIQSLESNAKNLSYIGLVLTKEYAVPWVAHIKQLLKKCCMALGTLSPEYPADMRSLSIYLHTLISFTGTKTWVLLNNAKNDFLRAGMNIICNTVVEFLVAEGLLLSLKSVLRRGLCRSNITLTHASLSALMRLTLLPLQNSQFSDKLVTAFLIHILSVPGLMLHLQRVSPESLTLMSKHLIFTRSLNLLNSEQNLKIVFNALEGYFALCLLGNLVHLAHIERDASLPQVCFSSFTNVVIWLLESCQHYVEAKQSNLTHWHPILGWFSQKSDASLQEAVPHTKVQLHFLSSAPLVSAILGEPLAAVVAELPAAPMESPSTSSGPFSAMLQKVTEKRLSRVSSAQPSIKIDGDTCRRIAQSCSVYHTALGTLTQLKLDIITGICYHDKVLYNLWKLIANIGIKQFLDQLSGSAKLFSPELQMMNLFADCMTHYVSILDDIEMYEQQDPFKLQDFVVMSNFFNVFLYKAISQNIFDVKTLNSNQLFQSVHTLFLVLLKRDSRRRYTPDKHWLIKEIRISSFISDLEKQKKPVQILLQKMPHILPQAERVRFFKKLVEADKEVSGLTESACLFPQRTHITVHRNRIVEDGYRQLGALPPLALKGVVRVHFINEQGLNEAGIDQDGVFKEFLEETIKRVFDPGLNLFRVTSEQRLYPSPTSHLVEDHLRLFEFVGRMLGKAVYEGIVVDVPFASFFVSQLLGQPQLALHSSMDELPSLDPELYQSLTFIKHTQTNVADLDLTFSVDCDYLGQVVTRELLPGGKAISVTNQNKIGYIHLMAHFRMHTQIKDQSAAFIRGFRSIINPDWLALFSTPELQRLISGDNVPIDLSSLRKYTQYYGGFHDSHRVIIWLWDILDKDFNEQEKSLFLKFVTSCSKPPLLGFAHLEPPFSIRCVEVSDDEDPGDTVGSVIRGFFTIRKKDPQTRLPTSSTCFNLLKLPNYQKKSTLREKLRYAVTSNTGFELS